MPTKKSHHVVVKSNKLIEASYRLDLIEQRIILACIVEARESQKGLDVGFVTLTSRRFVEMFDMEPGSVYGQLKDAMNTLFDRHLVVHDTDPSSGHPRVSKLRWISRASYIDGAGAIQLRFSEDLVPHIVRLEKEYTHFRLLKIGRLSSPYAVRLYELLVQYLKIGTRVIEISWLRGLLELHDEYKAIKDFKLRVIDTAINQINNHTDITVRYEQRKTGRYITHLIFTIVRKEEPPVKTARIRRPKQLELPAFITDAESVVPHPENLAVRESREKIRAITRRR